MLQHGLSIRWCVMAGCKEHWQNWKWDACVCVLRLWNCPDLCVNNSPTALCYAANQCGSVPGNSKYLCLPRLRFSHCFFFFPLLLLLLLGTFNALHTYNCSTWKCQLHIQDPLLHYCLFGCRKLVFSTFKFTERELIWGGRTVRIAGRRLTLPTARKQWRVNHNLRGFLSKDESEFVFSFPSDSHWRVKSEVNN